MRKKPLRPPENGGHDAPGAGQAALDQPKPGEDKKMNIVNPNTSIEKAPGPVSGGLSDRDQAPLRDDTKTGGDTIAGLFAAWFKLEQDQRA